MVNLTSNLNPVDEYLKNQLCFFGGDTDEDVAKNLWYCASTANIFYCIIGVAYLISIYVVVIGSRYLVAHLWPSQPVVPTQTTQKPKLVRNIADYIHGRDRNRPGAANKPDNKEVLSGKFSGR